MIGLTLAAPAALEGLVSTLLPLSDLVRDQLRRAGTFKLKARGGSMWPFLRDGDVVWLREAALGDLRIGDVICYADSGDRLFVHRLVDRDGDTLVTRGDMLTYVDRVPAHAFLGRAIAFERNGRHVRLETTWQRRLSRTIVWLAPVLVRPLSLAVTVRRLWRNVRHV